MLKILAITNTYEVSVIRELLSGVIHIMDQNCPDGETIKAVSLVDAMTQIIDKSTEPELKAWISDCLNSLTKLPPVEERNLVLFL